MVATQALTLTTNHQIFVALAHYPAITSTEAI